MPSYTTSASMRAAIEGFEGLRLQAYQDSVGVWTIGYGHTPATPGAVITWAMADNILSSDLAKFERGVNAACADVATTQGQFDALVSFAFNLGLGALEESTLLRLHRDGNYAGAAGEFVKWDHAGGQVLTGLLLRRKYEAQVYTDASPA